jgi:glycosyltransferase involved in cell wall biosynthesis
MEQVTVILPAFNEEQAIGPVIDQLRALPGELEVIVVDDCSTDRTAAVAHERGARVIRHPENCGYGKSLKDGINAASHDIIVIADADGSYPIAEIPRLLETFVQGFDMVVGARQGAAYRGTFLKMPARIIFKWLVEFTTGRHIPDVNSGLRVFRRSTVQKYFGDICNGFSFTTTITLIYLLTGKVVAYLPVPYGKRVGRSKVRIIRDSLRTLQYITECIVRYNPLKLFLILGIVTMLWGVLGGYLFGWMVLFEAGLVTALLCGLGCIAESMRRPLL